jgi:hypothetical protein
MAVNDYNAEKKCTSSELTQFRAILVMLRPYLRTTLRHCDVEMIIVTIV